MRTASVIALHPGVECLTLDRDSFNQLIGDMSEIKEKSYGDEERQGQPLSASNQEPQGEFIFTIELVRIIKNKISKSVDFNFFYKSIWVHLAFTNR